MQPLSYEEGLIHSPRVVLLGAPSLCALLLNVALNVGQRKKSDGPPAILIESNSCFYADTRDIAHILIAGISIILKTAVSPSPKRITERKLEAVAELFSTRCSSTVHASGLALATAPQSLLHALTPAGYW